MSIEALRALWGYLLVRSGIAVRREGGGMSTEMAVITGLLVVLALTVGGIIIANATNHANSIPEPSGP